MDYMNHLHNIVYFLFKTVNFNFKKFSRLHPLDISVGHEKFGHFWGDLSPSMPVVVMVVI